MKIKNFIIEVIVVLYVSLFIYTALSKLMDYDLSREQMATMPLVGPISGFVTWSLPTSELILAVLIFLPSTRIKGIYLGTALMLFFTVYVWHLMKFHSGTPCTCGGLLQTLSWPQHLAFNGIYVLLGVLALVLAENKHKTAANTKISLNKQYK